MVWVSKTAIQFPSSTCNFAYIASSPDPAGRLRSHFNNIKVRDAEHESYFRKPFCVFCGDVITPKTRKGLWKSDMNKHELVTHSAEFVESVERHDQQERVMLYLTRYRGRANQVHRTLHLFYLRLSWKDCQENGI